MSSPGGGPHNSDMHLRVNVDQVNEALRAVENLEQRVRSLLGLGGGGYSNAGFGTGGPPPSGGPPGGGVIPPFGGGNNNNSVVAAITIQTVQSLIVQTAQSVTVNGSGGGGQGSPAPPNPNAPQPPTPNPTPSPNPPSTVPFTPANLVYNQMFPQLASQFGGHLPNAVPQIMGVLGGGGASLAAGTAVAMAAVGATQLVAGGIGANLRSQVAGLQGAQSALAGTGSIYDNEWDAHLRRTAAQDQWVSSLPIAGWIASPLIGMRRAEEERQAEAQRFGEMIEVRTDVLRGAGFDDRAERLARGARRARRDSDFEDDVRRYSGLQQEFGMFGWYRDDMAWGVKGDASETDAYRRGARSLQYFINPSYAGGAQAVFGTGAAAGLQRTRGAFGRVIAGDTDFLTNDALMGQLGNDQEALRQLAIGLSESRYAGARGAITESIGMSEFQIAQQTGGSIETRLGLMREARGGLEAQLAAKQSAFQQVQNMGGNVDPLELEKLRGELAALRRALADNAAATRELKYGSQSMLLSAQTSMAQTGLRGTLAFGDALNADFGPVGTSMAAQAALYRSQSQDMSYTPEQRAQFEAMAAQTEQNRLEQMKGVQFAQYERKIAGFGPGLATMQGEAAYVSRFGDISLTRQTQEALVEEQYRLAETRYRELPTLANASERLRAESDFNAAQAARRLSLAEIQIAESQGYVGLAGIGQQYAQIGFQSGMSLRGSAASQAEREQMISQMRNVARAQRGVADLIRTNLAPGSDPNQSLALQSALLQAFGGETQASLLASDFQFAPSPGIRTSMSNTGLQIQALSTLYNAQGEMRPLVEKQLVNIQTQMSEAQRQYEQQRTLITKQGAPDARDQLARLEAGYTEQRNQMASQAMQLEAQMQIGFMDKVVSSMSGQNIYSPFLAAEFSRAELGLKGSVSTQLFGGSQQKIDRARMSSRALTGSFAGGVETRPGLEDTIGKAVSVNLGGTVRLQIELTDRGTTLYNREVLVDASSLSGRNPSPVVIQQ